MRHRQARRGLAPLGLRMRARFVALCRISIQPRDHKAVLVLLVGLIVASSAALILGAGSSAKRTAALPPTPPSPSASATTGPATASSAAGRPKATAAPFRCGTRGAGGGGDQPTQLCIPSLRVDTSVMQLGLNSDGTVEVPPLSRVRDAGWYRNSAAPGTVGPTVILGHVDSAQYGEGVFFHLAALHAGDQVQLRRGDGRTAVYRVDTVDEVSKSRFPSQQVYGATSGPAIRLVTCGGKFDVATGNYLDNIIAYGTLLRVTAA